MGTLLAFTMVAISVLILRYVTPDEVPLPSSLQESIDSVSLLYGQSSVSVNGKKLGTSSNIQPLLSKKVAPVADPIIKQFQGIVCPLYILASVLESF